jgi:hypothetical protein
MNFKMSSNCKFRELTLEEAKSINGGHEPDTTTSFWHDFSYYTSYGIGRLYKAMAKEGMFTKDYWEDFSIDLSS